MHITVGGEGGLTLEFIYKDEIDSCARPLVEHAKQRRAFKGDISEIYYLPILGEDGKVLIGLGEKENLTLDKVRKIFFELAKLMLNNEESKVTVDSARFDQFEARLLAEALRKVCFRRPIASTVIRQMPNRVLIFQFIIARYQRMRKRQRKVLMMPPR